MTLTRTQFEKLNPKALEWLKKNEPELLQMWIPVHRWTKEKLIKIARQFKTPTEWKKQKSSSYRVAMRWGILKECTSHMMPRGLWTLEKCLESSKQFSTKSDWWVGDYMAAKMAKKNGWFDICTEHMEYRSTANRLKPFWTKQKCIANAKKFSGRTKWKKENLGAYAAAKRNGWLEECRRHMVRSARSKKVKRLDTRQVFKSANEASISLGYNRKAVAEAIRENWKCNGTFWEYVK